MCLDAAKELCRSYQIKRLRKQRNIEVIWSHHFCNIRFLQPLFDKGSVAVACRQQLDTIKSWCIWMNQLPSNFLPAVHDGICSQLQPCQSSESSSGSGLYQRDITGLRQINALWKSNGARPPLCLGRAHDFQLALLTIICLPLNIGTTRTNQPQYGTLSAVFTSSTRAERHAIGQRLPCSLDGSCTMPHPVALESFRIPVLSPILNAIAHLDSPSQNFKRNTARDPRFTFSIHQPFLISPSLYCRLKLLLGNLGHSIAQQSSLHTSSYIFILCPDGMLDLIGFVDCLQLPIPVHPLRNKLDSLHAAVSVVVRNLWRSLDYSAEYSNQNLSNVTSAPGWLQGLTAANATYASLCTFQPRLPPEFSCLWHPTNCGHLTMDTTSSDKHSA